MSKPRGTLKWKFGRTSRRLATVFSIRPGTGRPSSTQRLPPWASTMWKLWLPPKVWLQGSQSSRRSWWRVRKGQACAICFWLAQSMRWLLTTTLGTPVEPEVSRYLAGQCGRIAAKAFITAGDSSRSSSSAKDRAPSKAAAFWLNTTGTARPQARTGGP